jgi:hypothetical protein
LLAEWDEIKKLYRGPYIDAFCQVWSSCFRGEDFLTLANQKQELPLAAISVGGMGQNEETL